MRASLRAPLRVLAFSGGALAIVVARPARADIPSCEWLSSQEPETEKAPNNPPAEQTKSDQALLDELRRAEGLYDRGMTAFTAKKWDEAANYFSEVLTICHSPLADFNLARALEEAARFDEAVEAYQRAAREPQLDKQQRVISTSRNINDLLKKVVVAHIKINVDASVFVDGRPRGKIGNHSDLYLLPGHHELEFVRPEYKGYTLSVDVSADPEKPVTLTVKLEPALLGALRVEEESPPARGQPGASVFVDGVFVGSTPWEDAVGAGPHVIWIRRDDAGSPPKEQTVTAGQIALVRLPTRPLGPMIVIETNPPEASVKIDGVLLGRGTRIVRLPTSNIEVQIVVEQEGYLPESRSFVVTPGSEPVRLHVDLARRPLPPVPPPTGSSVVSAFASLLYGANAGNATRGVVPCGSFCSAGLWGGARVEYLMLNGISVGVEAGYGLLYTTSEMAFDLPYSLPSGARRALHYTVTDRLRTHGPFIGAEASYQKRIGGAALFVARPSFGVLFASTDDAIRGVACAEEEQCSPVGTPPAGTRSAPMGFVGTEVGVKVRLGRVGIDAALGVLAFPEKGPSLERRQIGSLAHDCDPGNLDAPGCAPNQWIDPPGGSPSRGPFLLGTVSVAASYAF